MIGFRGSNLGRSTWIILYVVALSPVIDVAEGQTRVAGDASRATKRVLIVTGHQHPAHNWREVTTAILAASRRDERLEVTAGDIALLGNSKLMNYDAVVMNYCNWEKPGLSGEAQKNFEDFLSAGGGLVIIHFANGAFHHSLPGAKESDWPEWRTQICRRVWDHTTGKSGHDPYGKFQVDISAVDHPITRGLKSFETIDELYFNQQGTEPIEVLATARSKVTEKDEPIAFVYRYGKGRVFQTVLGHAAESLEVPSVAELVCRAMIWSAGGEPLSGPVADAPPTKSQSNAVPGQPRSDGHHGQSLDAAPRFAKARELRAYFDNTRWRG